MTADRPGLDVTQFRQLFEGSIRVLLNWDALADSQPTVECGTFVSPEHVAHWFTPWYPRDDGGDEYLAGERPLRLRELRAEAVHLSLLRRVKLQEIAASQLLEPAPLLVAAYHFSAQGTVLLDGNHRLSAALMYRIPVTVLCIGVRASLDANILPDLANLRGSE